MSEKPDWRIQWLVAQARDERLTDAEVRSIIANFPRDPALSVPEGWVAVPREPTEEMLRAGATDNTPRVATNSLDRMFESVGHIYRAMLSAIPSPGGEGNV